MEESQLPLQPCILRWALGAHTLSDALALDSLEVVCIPVGSPLILEFTVWTFYFLTIECSSL